MAVGAPVGRADGSGVVGVAVSGAPVGAGEDSGVGGVPTVGGSVAEAVGEAAGVAPATLLGAGLAAPPPKGFAIRTKAAAPPATATSRTSPRTTAMDGPRRAGTGWAQLGGGGGGGSAGNAGGGGGGAGGAGNAGGGGGGGVGNAGGGAAGIVKTAPHVSQERWPGKTAAWPFGQTRPVPVIERSLARITTRSMRWPTSIARTKYAPSPAPETRRAG